VREALASHPEEMAEVREAIERVKAEGTHWYLDQKGKPHTRSHWSGMSTAEVAQQVGWRTKDDTLFREASQFIHPGMHGFSGFFRFEEPNLVILRARPTDDVEEVRGVLGGAAIYFAHVSLAWAETLHADEVAAQLRSWMGDEAL